MQRLFGLVVFAAVIAACGGSDAGPDGSSRTGSTDPTTPTGGSIPSGPPSAPGGPGSRDDASSSADSGSPGSGGARLVRFVALGDTGTGSADQAKVGNAISAFCKSRGCDFVQLLGDNLYESGASSVDDPIWQSNFEIPYAAIDLDFYAVLGNHDYGAKGLGTDFPKGKNEIDYTSKSKKWKMPSAYYRHAPPAGGGLVEIFALDTNMAMFGRDSDQRAAVSGWLGASTAPWKIAVGHHPYKSNGSHGNAGSYDAMLGISLPPMNGQGVKSYLEGAICGKVDLYISGHDHSRQWLNETCKGTELAVSGAGAKATELGGKNPALFESLGLGFLYVVVEEKKLTAEFVDENGAIDFTHVMHKP